MKIRKSLDSRIGYIAGSLGLLVATVASAFFPAFAGATGNLDSRSIALSSSASGATGVSYELKFTTENIIHSTGGMVIEFCDNNPLIGLDCSGAGANDINTSGVALGTVKYGATTESGGNAGSVAASTDTGT